MGDSVPWRYGRAAFAGVTKSNLWALAELCACSGLIALLSSEGKPLPILGAVILWVFAAYTIKVAGALRTSLGGYPRNRQGVVWQA